MVYIGIDPGKSGALAILHDYGGGEQAVDTTLVSFDEQSYIDALRANLNCYPVRGCVVERVGAMPGQGVTSMFHFGENFGFIQGVLRTLGIPFELVAPGTWKREFGVTRDKNTSIEVARRLFPGIDLRRTPKCVRLDDGMAEALLMAEYARRKLGGGAK